MKRAPILAALAALAALSIGCSSQPGGTGDDDIDDGSDAGVTDPGTDAAPQRDEWDELLDQREYDYNAALRIAALRLTGDLPTLAEIKFVADAVDQQAAYEALVAQYIEDPRFTVQMIRWWRDTLKISGSAPLFAAQITVEDRSYAELLTATTGTCPTYDGATGAFTAADCVNNVPVHAGLLSHPGLMAHYMSNMAFRRTRFVQETFACTAFPAETTTPIDVGGNALYTSPWPFESIAGFANGGTIDFLDTSAVACANCHSTMNHVAPLFGQFDGDGMWSVDIQVTNPTEGLPITAMTDWLPPGEGLAWRLGQPVTDLPSLGAVMAADPAIAECAVARTWNWAFGKGDIVDALAIVPSETIEAQVAEMQANGMRLKPIIFSVFTSDDFVRF